MRDGENDNEATWDALPEGALLYSVVVGDIYTIQCTLFHMYAITSPTAKFRRAHDRVIMSVSEFWYKFSRVG